MPNLLRRAHSRCIPATAPSAALTLAMLVALLAVPRPAAAVTLRYQANEAGDFALIGNTLGQDCSPGAPAPVVGTVGDCGSFTSDPSPDVFWISNDPTGAMADVSNPATSSRSTAMLTLPGGASVVYARLYWSASGSTAAADTDVTLDRVGAGAFSAPVTADASFTNMQNGQAYYQSTADVTSLVQANGTGSYRVSGVDAWPFQNVDSDGLYAAWWMVVFYRTAGSPVRNLAIFDGLDVIETPGAPQMETVSGFQVPIGAYDAKLGVVGYLGTPQINGDLLAFNGVTVSNAVNPADNFFNGTRSYFGAPVSVVGDLPQLTGGPGSVSGVDLDVVNVAPLVTFGDTSATITADTRLATYLLGAFVTSITTTGPDFSATTKTVADLTGHPGGAVLPGDTLEYTITATNKGSDTATDVTLSDPLPAGLTYVPGSISIISGANAGTKTDAAGDDQAEFLPGSATVRVRLGTGSDATTGGTMARNETTTLVFRAQVTGTKLGLISNQATITMSGLSGVAMQTFLSDGNPNAAGAQTTDVFIDECLAGTDCSAPTAVCLTSTSPKRCVVCASSADCSGTSPICNGRTHTCRACQASSECPTATPVCDSSGACVQCLASTDCGGATPVCNPATKSCVGCLSGADCGGTKPVCDAGSLVCRGCGGDGECSGATPACQPSGACGQCSATNPTACSGATPVCDVVNGNCVRCTASADCSGMTPVCNFVTHTCRACAGDGDCGGATPACQSSGACGQCSATNATACSGATPACAVSAGVCVACTSNAQCGGATPVCNVATNTCRACAIDAECSVTAPACDPSGACVRCLANRYCSGATPVCNSATKVCVGCLANSDCAGATPFCNLAVLACRACAADTDCGGTTPACQPSGACSQCSAGNATACMGAMPVCNTSTGTCAGCVSNANCGGTTPVCDSTMKVCRSCASDTDCPAAMPACQPSGGCGQCSARNSLSCTGATSVCNAADGTCVGCVSNVNCGGTAPVCDATKDTCRACIRDADCGGSAPICQPSGACGQCSATNRSACGGATTLCDLAKGLCVGCLSGADCSGVSPVCDAASRMCRGCSTDSECGGRAPACQASGGCGQCSASNTSRCGGTLPACDVAAGACVACLSDSQCSGTAPVCNVATQTCRACAVDIECPASRPACQRSGACGVCSDTNNSRCVGRAIATCDTATGTCEACIDDSQCGGTKPVCQSATHTCRSCETDADCAGATPACQGSGACGQCSASNARACGGATPVCEVASGFCVPCLTSADCSGSAPICETAIHACRGCASDAECAGGTLVCAFSGACVAGADGGVADGGFDSVEGDGPSSDAARDDSDAGTDADDDAREAAAMDAPMTDSFVDASPDSAPDGAPRVSPVVVGKLSGPGCTCSVQGESGVAHLVSLLLLGALALLAHGRKRGPSVP